MSIRTTIDAPDVRPEIIESIHLKADPSSLAKVTNSAMSISGANVVLHTSSALHHGSTTVIGTDAKIPWSVLKSHPSVTAGDGLSGGGALSGNVTLSVNSTVLRT